MPESTIAGIILAAGRGSRMKDLTREHPKCLTRLAGRSLLDWQIDALEKAGAGRLLVVRGYKKECLQGPFETVDNDNWQNTNMLSSLLCAGAFARDFFARGGRKILISYSDIVYRPEHARKLASAGGHIAIAYDTQWEVLWRLRFEDPLADAETFLEKKGRLVEIGGKSADIADICGQYMGLLALDRKGWAILEESCAALGEKSARLDMTAFLRLLLARKIEIGAVPVAGGWCETDSGEDLAKYEQALARGAWTHDWRN